MTTATTIIITIIIIIIIIIMDFFGSLLTAANYKFINGSFAFSSG